MSNQLCVIADYLNGDFTVKRVKELIYVDPAEFTSAIPVPAHLVSFITTDDAMLAGKTGPAFQLTTSDFALEVPTFDSRLNHKASQWQIATDAGFIQVYSDSGETGSPSGFSVNPGKYGVTAFARVRHQYQSGTETVTVGDVQVEEPTYSWTAWSETLQFEIPNTWTVSTGGDVEPPSLDYVKDAVRARVLLVRNMQSTKGVTINGAQVATDSDSQRKIHEVAYALDKGMATTVNYKTLDGFQTFTSEQFLKIAQGVYQYVQACYAVEASHLTTIDAATDTDLATICTLDLATGWPSTTITVA